MIWDVWMKTDVGFDRVMTVLEADRPHIENTFKTMTCGTALIIL